MVRGTWMLKPWLFVKRLTSCSFRQTNLINISFLNFDRWKNVIYQISSHVWTVQKTQVWFRGEQIVGIYCWKIYFNIILCNHLWGMVIDCRKRANSFVKDVRRCGTCSDSLRTWFDFIDLPEWAIEENMQNKILLINIHVPNLSILTNIIEKFCIQK